ncbi:MAG: hypothetical protein M1814_003023 [Vezdaea aestivalis]|nr:MAG: hypothetical protein M1814_003023 [Vezdaea aestivalis]
MASPTAIMCVGMAGSGKTTFMQRINSHLHSKSKPPYVINLDPAVHKVPYESNIDIRDSVNYKEVMKQWVPIPASSKRDLTRYRYNLGPNGGIITSLNLFATKVDQIMNLLEKRAKPDASKPNAKPIQHILVDTPGQIEVFVWSASGSILLDSFASSFPTVVAYIIDTPRTSSTSTFMSNMLYACSILYKTKLPMILVFNKIDVQDAEFAKSWMTDFEAFQKALRTEEETGNFGGNEGGLPGIGGGSGYMGSLLNSMSLMLEEFYNHLSVVAVSSLTGQGIDDFFVAVQEKTAEFEKDYRPELERRKKEVSQKKEDQRSLEMDKLLKDMNIATKPKSKSTANGSKDKQDTLSDAQNDGEEHGGWVDRDEDESDEEADDNDAGLTARYQEQLGRQGAAGSVQDEASFAKYIHSSNPR